MPKKRRLPTAGTEARKARKPKSYPDAMRDVYKRVDKLARDIGLPNLGKLDKVTVAHAHRVVSEIEARYRAATGGAPLRPEISAAIEVYLADVKMHTAPLADAARHEQSTAAAGLPTPFEREHQHRKLKREVAKKRARKSAEARIQGHEGGEAKAKALRKPIADRDYKMRVHAERLRQEDERQIPKKLADSGLYRKKVLLDGVVTDGDPLSVDTISGIINAKEK